MTRIHIFRTPLRVPVLALLVGVALSLGCGGGKEGRTLAPPVPVKVGKVVMRSMPVTFRAIGHVEPIETVAVTARVGGELIRVHFTEGQDVRKGEVLFTIDPRPFEASLAVAEAALERDRALLAKAEADSKRYADLVQKDFVTKEQYDQMVTNAASLRAAVSADDANIQSAELNLSYCTIVAPVSGRTGNLNLKPGNLVKANGDAPLVTINQMRPIFASFSVPAHLLPLLAQHDGKKIEVSARLPQDDGGPEEGLLTFVDNAVDAATAMILLKATFANEDLRLWPGQFVDVVVTVGEEPNRIVAPAQAVQTGQQGTYVFVVNDDLTVEMRMVKVARIDEVEAVIDGGVRDGETVVTDGQLRLTPGARVEIKGGNGQGEG